MLNSDELIGTLEGRVENHLATAIRVFQNLDTATLLQPSPHGGWSIAQCLDHLNGYGDYYLPKIEKAIQKSSLIPSSGTFTSGWLGSYFTKMMDPTTGKKFKAFKDHIPEVDLDPNLVVATFIHQQELLLRYLEQSKNIDLAAARIPISISKLIRLKLGDVFQFLIMHNERHIQQALRNLDKQNSNVYLSDC